MAHIMWWLLQIKGPTRRSAPHCRLGALVDTKNSKCSEHNSKNERLSKRLKREAPGCKIGKRRLSLQKTLSVWSAPYLLRRIFERTMSLSERNNRHELFLQLCGVSYLCFGISVWELISVWCTGSYRHRCRWDGNHNWRNGRRLKTGSSLRCPVVVTVVEWSWKHINMC